MKERDLKKGKKKKRKYITLKQLIKEIDKLIGLCKARMKELDKPKRHPKKTCEPSIKHTSRKRVLGRRFKHGMPVAATDV